MASKKRQGKKNSGAGNPAKAAQRGRSVHKVQAEPSLDALRDYYVAWAAAEVSAISPAAGTQTAEIQLGVIRTIGGECAETARSSNLFDLDPELFGQALADFLVNLSGNVAPEPIFSTWLDFFYFAEDTSLWQGSTEILEEVREMLEDALDGFAKGHPEICALLRARPLFATVKNFVMAIGDGIEINDFTDSTSSSRDQVFEAMGIDVQSVGADASARCASTTSETRR